MKKRRYSRAVCLAAVILTMLFCAVFPARVRAEEGHIGHVIDTYGLFSDADFSELEAACEQFEQQTGIQTAILSVNMDTVGGSRDKDSIRFIEDYADHLPEDDFVGLIINMDTRYYYIDVRGGEALRIYTDSRQEQLGDDVVDELAQGNYLGAGEAFLDGARRQCEYARNNNSYGEIREGKSGFELDTFVVAAALGAIISAIATGARAKKHKEIQPAREANQYIVPGTIDLYKNSNVFVSQYVTRVPINEEKSDRGSGGGGGFTTTHTSSGGSSHSGHGGHF